MEVSDPSSLLITQCVTLKLNEKNYLLWKLQFEQFLSSQQLIGFVTGATIRPPATINVRTGEQVTETTNPEYLKWVQKDQMVKAWLYGSFSESALKAVYGLNTSQEVWFTIAKKFNRVSATRKLDLQRRIQTTVKGTRLMADYLSEIKSLCDQLDSIGSPISEEEKIYGVLNGLGKEYESICTVIENSMDLSPCPSLEDVIFKLTGFDDKLQSYEEPATITPHQAFYTQRGGYSGRGQGQNRGGFRGRGFYSTQGRGFPQQFGQNSNRGGSYSNTGQRPTCQICGKYGHSAAKCYNRFDSSFESPDLPQAMNAMKISDPDSSSGHEWYPDTGASAHITNSNRNLQQSQEYRGNENVVIADGNFLPITHIGSVPLHTMSGQAHQTAPDSRKQT